jgi:tetratricopeptide (TPR) repeat protein
LKPLLFSRKLVLAATAAEANSMNRWLFSLAFRKRISREKSTQFTMISLHLFLIALGSLPVSGQEIARQALQHAFQLNEQGQFAQVIELVKPLTSAPTLSAADLGRAWLLLAMAYHQEGRFADAATAYEQSLHLLANNPEYSAQYAAALSAYAILYRDTARMEIAWKMQMKALHVYDGIHDQAGIARVCKSLAILALSQKRTSKARGYLRCAIEASKVANGLNDDYFAELSSTQAGLELLDKHYAAAESEYQHALTLWKHLYGDQYFLVGWGYMLLGEANAQARDMTDALDNMRKGLGILEKTAGNNNIKFLDGELAYAKVLDASGAHTQARELKTAAEEALQDLYRSQCIQCRISAAALSLR